MLTITINDVISVGFDRAPSDHPSPEEQEIVRLARSQGKSLCYRWHESQGAVLDWLRWLASERHADTGGDHLHEMNSVVESSSGVEYYACDHCEHVDSLTKRERDERDDAQRRAL